MELPTLAGILRAHWSSFRAANAAQLCAAHYRAVRSVLACRTPKLGGRIYRCGDCSRDHFAYHSCNHRNCPQCGALDQQIWSARQEARLLPVPYFMVTFTVARELRATCARHPKELYDLLLRESAHALRDIVATKTKGHHTACIAVLHTWGRQMQHHPHIHLIVPAVALHPANATLHRPENKHFLVHHRPLAARFRSRIHTALREQHPDIYATLPAAARDALRPGKNWNVHLRHVGGGKTAIRYLARYVRRSAFHPGRLLGFDGKGNILLRWTDSTTGRRGVLHLHPHEFIRRWLQHVLPKGFPRIRHYGYLSGAAKRSRALLRLLLRAGAEPEPSAPAPLPHRCPHCGGELTFLREILKSHTIHTRGPPSALP